MHMCVCDKAKEARRADVLNRSIVGFIAAKQ